MKRACIHSAFIGIFAATHLTAATHYVDLNSSNPTPPYADWSTAATNIQDAIAAAVDGDQVLVTNGVYQTGGRVVYALTNRVAVNKAIAIQSVNGPGVTSIAGRQTPVVTNGFDAIRCVYLTNNAVLSGFTVTGGATGTAGGDVKNSVAGGIWSESTNAVVTNCVITGNSGDSLAAGVYNATLNNCTISNCSGMSAVPSAVRGCVLNQCVLTGSLIAAESCQMTLCTLCNNTNAAADSTLDRCLVCSNTYGVGGCFLTNCLVVGNRDEVIYECGTVLNCTIVRNLGRQTVVNSQLYNCIVYYNTDTNLYGSELIDCCVESLYDAFIVTGAITREPRFVDVAGGDFHLRSDSPCINSGGPAYIPYPGGFLRSPGTQDLDDNPRVSGGTVDIGAYECPSPASIISYAWLMQYGLPTDGSADFVDFDGDGMNNWQEWHVGTVPTDPKSVFKISRITNSAPGTIQIIWRPNVFPKTMFIQRSTNLASGFVTISTNVVGTSYIDKTATGSGPYFYRVGMP
jgi:hypothetical protein